MPVNFCKSIVYVNLCLWENDKKLADGLARFNTSLEECLSDLFEMGMPGVAFSLVCEQDLLAVLPAGFGNSLIF